jgi:hypothetical protein
MIALPPDAFEAAQRDLDRFDKVVHSPALSCRAMVAQASSLRIVFRAGWKLALPLPR